MTDERCRPMLFNVSMVRAILDGRKTQTRRIASLVDGSGGGKCPYGGVGDRLWVREKWRAEELETGEDGVRFAADDGFSTIANSAIGAERWLAAWGGGRHGTNWRPSIFMPRWASRITLEVVDMNVERLHEISEDDAKAEGVYPCEHDAWFGGLKHVSAYGTLWEKINGKVCPWVLNPWVWAVTFKRVPQAEMVTTC